MAVFNKQNIGFMQSRLSSSSNNKLQFFPWENWENEFYIGAENNYQIIEWTIDSYDIDKNPFFVDTKKIMKLKEVTNFCISGVTCDFLMENPYYKKNDNSINSLEYLKKTIESCYLLGVNFIVFPLVDNGSIKNESYDKLYNSLIKLSNLLDKQVNIVFELDLDPYQVLKFIKNFDKTKFGINYDTGNSASYGYDFESEMRLYFNYIKNIHIKDRKRNSTSITLGDGDFDFKKFKNFLNINNYNGLYILQTAKVAQSDNLLELNKNRSYVLNLNNEF